MSTGPGPPLLAQLAGCRLTYLQQRKEPEISRRPPAHLQAADSSTDAGRLGRGPVLSGGRLERGGGPKPAATRLHGRETDCRQSLGTKELARSVSAAGTEPLQSPHGELPRPPPRRAADRRRRRHGLARLRRVAAAALPGGGEHPRAGHGRLRPPQLHQRRRRADRDEHLRREPPQARGALPRGRARADQRGRGEARPRRAPGLRQGGLHRRLDRPARRARGGLARGSRAALRRAGARCSRAAASTCSWSRRSSTSTSSSPRSRRCARSRACRSSR